MQPWLDADGNEILFDSILSVVSKYVKKGGKVYIGADSMLKTTVCTFACVIALHDKNQDVYMYFFKKHRENNPTYKDLTKKINTEVELSINTAWKVHEALPGADIEIHVDIGSKKRNKTRYLVDPITGWIKGSGFSCQIKPFSWASALADGHTK